MKYIFFLLTMALCLVWAGEAHAQRALKGMRALEVRGGMVDGFYSSSSSSKTGFYCGAAISSYVKNANKWVFGFEYLNRNYPYKECRIPVAQFTGEGGYYYKFLTDGSKTFFFYLGGSALAGYETVNWGTRRLYDGSTIQNKDRFLYGGAISFEAEAYLTDRLIFVMSARERVLWGTTTGHFHTQFGFGLKLIFN